MEGPDVFLSAHFPSFRSSPDPPDDLSSVTPFFRPTDTGANLGRPVDRDGVGRNWGRGGGCTPSVLRNRKLVRFLDQIRHEAQRGATTAGRPMGPAGRRHLAILDRYNIVYVTLCHTVHECPC